ncbi:MAG: Nucleotidyltransferase substrate binding protein like [Candidatus Kentron sp. G]|nr:MAG: Nucleotidyltransferase substrate binding protein like [Candidatus Kentron sp. G]VFN05758.1 MAG: Nucleotidyltransferase substrate binding protein like [Candidatus Kentron sp. G]
MYCRRFLALPAVLDGLQNGKAQKFEYTLEFCWKTIKVFLRQQEGIDEASPKKIIKAFYLAGHLADCYVLRNSRDIVP